ncbi:oxidoreductase [Streptomyces sp. Ru72]|nr:molybdopterin-dependent oxidoreductase [Streptomyces sp. Ru72]POX47212.1 oxidoreductase [Streptomyces sp. Ru72]
MLGMLGAGAAGLAAAPRLQRGWEGFLGAASQVDPTGLTGLLPNPGGFRYYSVVGSVPHKDEMNYQLTVGGLVEKPRTYTLADLRAMPQTRVVHDVLCTDGWRVDKTPFEGVKPAGVLDAAGVRSPGAAVRFTCFDGAYTESLTLGRARRSDVLVALDMQDRPLAHDHGGPGSPSFAGIRGRGPSTDCRRLLGVPASWEPAGVSDRWFTRSVNPPFRHRLNR